MPSIKPIALGDEVQDTVTGFTGIAVARTTWITGCDRITVQPKGFNKDKGTVNAESFDEPMLKIIKRKNAPKKSKSTSGGPRPEPMIKSL